MNWLSMCLKLISHIPVGQIFYRPKGRGKALDDLSQALALKEAKTSVSPVATPPVLNETPPRAAVSTDETITYQRREIGKELLLLEKHFQQHCKIGGKACDCCEKHPITIEALVQETLGMTEDPVLDEIILWAKTIAPVTTEEASASGKHDHQYPGMAIKARDLRKRLMGTVNINSLLSPELTDRVNIKVKQLVEEVVGQ